MDGASGAAAAPQQDEEEYEDEKNKLNWIMDTSRLKSVATIIINPKWFGRPKVKRHPNGLPFRYL